MVLGFEGLRNQINAGCCDGVVASTALTMLAAGWMKGKDVPVRGGDGSMVSVMVTVE